MAKTKPPLRERKSVTPAIIGVQICEALPNKMFTEQHRALVRFLRYTAPIPCAECGKRRRIHWTLLFSFQAMSMGFLVPVKSGKIHLPLTPVCTNHILAHPDHDQDAAHTLLLDGKGHSMLA